MRFVVTNINVNAFDKYFDDNFIRNIIALV